MEEKIELKVKPLSKNRFIAFFEKMHRSFLLRFYLFSEKHQKAAKVIYQIVMFFTFSILVTLFQYIVMTFLPYLLGSRLAGVKFIWPEVTISLPNFKPFNWSLLGYDVIYDSKSNLPLIGGGLGYFISYELATFFAQVINFPLQRNYTYKSHGNPYYQAMWYFIAWVIISIICNGITSFWIGFAVQILPDTIYQILTTMVTGFISMIVFFFIFKIIFPDYEKESENAKKKLEKMVKSNASESKINRQREIFKKKKINALINETRREYEIALKKYESIALEYQLIKEKSNDDSMIKEKYQLGVKAYKEMLQKQEKYQNTTRV